MAQGLWTCKLIPAVFSLWFIAQIYFWLGCNVILQELTHARREAQEKYIQTLKEEAEILKIHREPNGEIQQIQEDMEQG